MTVAEKVVAQAPATVEAPVEVETVVEVRGNRQRTFIMLKPEAVQRGLIHKAIIKLQGRGFKLVAMKMCRPEKSHFEEHYAEHKGKSFFEPLCGRITRGPVVAMVWEGDNVIATTRKMIGATDPIEAEMGTFRGDYGLSKQMNGFHGSDSVEAADREIALWFDQSEIIEGFEAVSEPWLYEGKPPTKTIVTKSVAPILDLQKPEQASTETPTEAAPKEDSQYSARKMAGYAGMAAVGVAVVVAGGIMMMRQKK